MYLRSLRIIDSVTVSFQNLLHYLALQDVCRVEAPKKEQPLTSWASACRLSISTYRPQKMSLWGAKKPFSPFSMFIATIFLGMFFFVPPKFETIIKKLSRFTHGCDNGPKRLGLLEWVYGLTYQKRPYFKRVHLFQGLSFWVSMLLVFGDVLR